MGLEFVAKPTAARVAKILTNLGYAVDVDDALNTVDQGFEWEVSAGTADLLSLRFFNYYDKLKFAARWEDTVPSENIDKLQKWLRTKNEWREFIEITRNSLAETSQGEFRLVITADTGAFGELSDKQLLTFISKCIEEAKELVKPSVNAGYGSNPVAELLKKKSA